MEPSKRLSYFNELSVDLNDEVFFSSEIYDRTMNNPNPHISRPCKPCNDSLDEYASQLSSKLFSTLRA
jgi:hypothetical protein